MSQEEMGNLMLEMKEDNKKMSETLQEIKEHNKKTDETLKEIREQNKKTDETLKEIREHNKNTDKTLEEMKKDISELKQETRKISGSVAVIEHQHGEKIQVLLDGHNGILSKLDSINKRFESDEERLDNHTFRIAALETKIETKILNQ